MVVPLSDTRWSPLMGCVAWVHRPVIRTPILAVDTGYGAHVMGVGNCATATCELIVNNDVPGNMSGQRSPDSGIHPGVHCR